VLSAWLFIHAAFTGGYPFYHPIELFCIRVGTFTGLLGLVMAVAGKGKIRISVTVISIVNLLIWYADALAQ
jgi:hypothetical protein